MRWRKKKSILEDAPDAEAMERAQSGDVEAFGVLVRKYQDPLLNFFRRLGVYQDAEDLVQESFVRVYRRLAHYRPTAKFTTYLYTVARRVWIDWVRRKSRRDQYLTTYAEYLAACEAAGGPRPGTAIDTQAALESLPEKLRLVVVMSIYQGLKYDEIATALEIPVGTVKSRMFLAISRIREFMDAGVERERPRH